jgi:hypothetical protein
VIVNKACRTRNLTPAAQRRPQQLRGGPSSSEAAPAAQRRPQQLRGSPSSSGLALTIWWRPQQHGGGLSCLVTALADLEASATTSAARRRPQSLSGNPSFGSNPILSGQWPQPLTSVPAVRRRPNHSVAASAVWRQPQIRPQLLGGTSLSAVQWSQPFCSSPSHPILGTPIWGPQFGTPT